jgi:hypothetical protein
VGRSCSITSRVARISSSDWAAMTLVYSLLHRPRRSRGFRPQKAGRGRGVYVSRGTAVETEQRLRRVLAAVIDVLEASGGTTSSPRATHRSVGAAPVCATHEVNHVFGAPDRATTTFGCPSRFTSPTAKPFASGAGTDPRQNSHLSEWPLLRDSRPPRPSKGMDVVSSVTLAPLERGAQCVTEDRDGL